MRWVTGSPKGNRTPDFALRGRRLNRLTMEPLAGELGFEPRQYESESQVLPLHHSPSAYRSFLDCESYYSKDVPPCQAVFCKKFDLFSTRKAPRKIRSALSLELAVHEGTGSSTLFRHVPCCNQNSQFMGYGVFDPFQHAPCCNQNSQFMGVRA